MSTPFDRAEFLPTSPRSLRYLLKSDWQMVLEQSLRKVLQPGDVLIEEGSASEGLYMVRSGFLRVEQVRGDDVVVLAERGPGSILGEVALLDVSPAMASVIAEELCEVYLIERHQLSALLTSSPSLALRFYISLATVLAERLTESADIFSQLHAMMSSNQALAESDNRKDIELLTERLAHFMP